MLVYLMEKKRLEGNTEPVKVEPKCSRCRTVNPPRCINGHCIACGYLCDDSCVCEDVIKLVQKVTAEILEEDVRG
ncbi:MAG: hypothetical protein WCJ54_07390 [Actinomycetota bacterium]